MKLIDGAGALPVVMQVLLQSVLDSGYRQLHELLYGG